MRTRRACVVRRLLFGEVGRGEFGRGGQLLDGHTLFRHKGTGWVWRKVEDLRFSFLWGLELPFVVRDFHY